jgi:hypothetical protein
MASTGPVLENSSWTCWLARAMLMPTPWPAPASMIWRGLWSGAADGDPAVGGSGKPLSSGISSSIPAEVAQENGSVRPASAQRRIMSPMPRRSMGPGVLDGVRGHHDAAIAPGGCCGLKGHRLVLLPLFKLRFLRMGDGCGA